MEPTLKNGTTVTARDTDSYSRGDIVVFLYPLDVKKVYIQRIVGLPGETIEIKDGKVFVNGEPLDEPYVQQQPTGSMPPKTMQADEYFVLGDNRNASNDSRNWGPVPRQNLRGVVR